MLRLTNRIKWAMCMLMKLQFVFVLHLQGPHSC
jgi:hypothetical protein